MGDIIDLSKASAVLRIITPYPELANLYVKQVDVKMLSEPILIPDGQGHGIPIGANSKVLIAEAWQYNPATNTTRCYKNLQIVGGFAFYEAPAPEWWQTRK